MRRQPTDFGRRGTRRAASGSPPASPAEGRTPTIGELMRHPRMFVFIPFTISVVTLIGLGFVNSARLTGKPAISAASIVSEAPSCRAKATAGSVFDIDWCQAAGAALRGAATGVAMGGARR